MDIVSQIKSDIKPGQVIPKPEATEDFVVKGWGIRRGEDALIYFIPNKKGGKRYEKGVNIKEWILAYNQLMDCHEFTRKWFNEYMNGCAEEGGCNFTTIGGIFELFGLARHEPGKYIKIC